jgi:hypothetical protein
MLITFLIHLPVWPFHSPLRTRLVNDAILSRTAMDVADYVFAIHLDLDSARRAQGHVQNRAALDDVDLFTTKHGIATLRHAALLRQLKQQAHGFIGHPVLGVIQEQAAPPPSTASRVWGLQQTAAADEHL